jgi:copper transport protein
VRPRLLLAFALAFAAVVTLAQPASAHAELESTEPSAGAILDTQPDAIELRFSENVTVDSVKVLDAEQHRVDAGKPTKPDGRTVRIALAPNLPDGGFVVAWKVVSADAHPIGGGFTYRVGASSTAVDPSVVQDLLAGQVAPRSVGVVFGVVRFAVFASLLLLVGGAAFVAALWPAGAERIRVRRLLWWSLGTLLAGSFLGLGLQGASVGGLGLTDVLKPSVVSDSLDTTFGDVWLLRIVLLVPAAALLQLLPHVRREWWRVAGAGLGLALVATPAFSGHADTGRWVGLAKIDDVAHLASGAVWLGGLAVLLLAALQTDVPDAKAITARFSSIAFGAVVVVVLTGSFQSVRQVVDLDGLETTYGRLLAVKVVLVLGLIGVASLTRAALHGRLPIGDAERVPGLNLPSHQGPGAQRADEHTEIGILRRLVGAEVAVAVIVLAVTALLVDANPGRAGTVTGGPFDQTRVVNASLTTGGASDVLINVVVVPGTVGPTDVHLYVDDPGGGLTPPVDATATLSLPASGITGIDVPFVIAGPKHWSANDIDVPIAGRWELRVDVLLTDVDKATTTFTVPIGGSS